MDISQKIVDPILVALINGIGSIEDFNRDSDKLFEYLYSNNFRTEIAGPLVGIFYTEFGGRYKTAIPIKKIILVPDPIQIQNLPKITCLSLVHQGSWKTINNSFEKIKRYEEENNIAWQFPVREVYLKSDGDEKDYRTEIQVSINQIRA